MVVLSNVSGFPRIGARRELKFATERYWAGKVPAQELEEAARSIRDENWRFMREAGIDLIPSNDFSFYDNVLDTIVLVGAVPARYRHTGGEVDLDTYFAMARGRQEQDVDVTAMEMLKWFDTNYHYIVPELSDRTEFTLSSDKPFAEYSEAKAQNIETVPVIIGPFTFLSLAKSSEGGDFSRLSLLEALLPVYEQVLERLGGLGAQWIQLDEPALVEDRTKTELESFSSAYARLAGLSGRPKIAVKTYFDHVGEAFDALVNSQIEGIGLDFHRGRIDESRIAEHPQIGDKTLFAGIVDGRGVWINDLEASLDLLERLRGRSGELVVSTSCSLLHVPIDLEAEPDLDDEVRSWLAFAKQKVLEVAVLTRGLNEGRESVEDELKTNRAALEARRTSPRTVNPEVRRRVSSLGEAEGRRSSNYSARQVVQREEFALPIFPTTTIGSYPQTADIRQARTKLAKGEISEEQYRDEMRSEIERVVRFQEEAGLDILVHGEAERNDMVQYFGEMLEGFVFTKNAWVQSYGSRYVRPPIIYGDVFRPFPMTVDWITYAQSLTDRPMKGMLTGPVTMLMWSFFRDDLPASEVCKQLALAVRDEVVDLEAAGIRIIQVDEPAIREGLPLHRSAWKEYLDWAVYCFRVATSNVADSTQIQTHLCYSEFGDIIDAVDEMDADVALIWCARAGMRLLDDLAGHGYRREVGPGVYDIHSPRIPSVEEMAEEIRLATKRLDRAQIWINPDCGLKTRKWEEAGPSVVNMVEAAKRLRSEFGAS